MPSVPQRTQVLVIGGGPAGATAATLLARQGIDVVCLERQLFPRYHIGESLLPSILEILDLMGAREKVESAGFVRKPGALLDWGGENWRLDFGELSGRHSYSYQVERAEFDRLLLEHARSQGAEVFQGYEATSVEWKDGRSRRAGWRHGETSGVVEFDFLIDASGRSGLIPGRYTRDRRYHDVFRNIALWRYWEGVEVGEPGFRGVIHVSSIPEGWWWMIPMREGRTSVGLVVHKDYFQTRRELGTAAIYDAAIRESEVVARVLASGEPVGDVRVESDYSYSSASFSGDGYFVCGDAACFLDPLLSTGVHLATFSALLASAAIGSVVRGELPEDRCRTYFETTYRKAYTRLLLMVSAFYNQNRGQRGYFWEAQRLTGGDARGFDVKAAFLHLVTGIEDLDETTQENDVDRVREAVAERLRENLALRQDKNAPTGARSGEERSRIEASDSFMKEMEGLFVLSRPGGDDDLYVATEPQLGLATVSSFRATST